MSECTPQPPVVVLQTQRLTLRRLDLGDAEFVLGLLNEPSFIQNIGDKGVRTVEDAVGYLRSGPLASYERFGFGLYRMGLREDDTPVGMCGLLKRDTLEDVDLGFALLPAYWSKGLAFEAASATLIHGRTDFGLKRVVAITSPDNTASIKLLGRLGFGFEGMIHLGEDPAPVRLFGLAL